MTILDTEYLSGMKHDIKIFNTAKHSILYKLASLCLLCIGHLQLDYRHYSQVPNSLVPQLWSVTDFETDLYCSGFVPPAGVNSGSRHPFF